MMPLAIPEGKKYKINETDMQNKSKLQEDTISIHSNPYYWLNGLRYLDTHYTRSKYTDRHVQPPLLPPELAMLAQVL